MSRTAEGNSPCMGAYLGPFYGDVENAVAEVESRSTFDHVTVTVSRIAAEDYVRYGLEPSTGEIRWALSEALEGLAGSLAEPRAGTHRGAPLRCATSTAGGAPGTA